MADPRQGVVEDGVEEAAAVAVGGGELRFHAIAKVICFSPLVTTR